MGRLFCRFPRSFIISHAFRGTKYSGSLLTSRALLRLKRPSSFFSFHTRYAHKSPLLSFSMVSTFMINGSQALSFGGGGFHVSGLTSLYPTGGSGVAFGSGMAEVLLRPFFCFLAGSTWEPVDCRPRFLGAGFGAGTGLPPIFAQ